MFCINLPTYAIIPQFHEKFKNDSAIACVNVRVVLKKLAVIFFSLEIMMKQKSLVFLAIWFWRNQKLQFQRRAVIMQFLKCFYRERKRGGFEYFCYSEIPRLPVYKTRNVLPAVDSLK